MAMPVRDFDLDWTVERALALPDDGNRYEVLDGELFVTPAPSGGHQSVLAKLFKRLDAYVEGQRLGWTRWSPADIVLSPRRLLQPDLFVVPWRDGGPPRADRHRKRQIYQNEGVSEYWIIDGDARLIERWRPADERPEILYDELLWHPRPDVAPFRIEIAALFDEADR
jgi:Uma2 family endonuclease